MCTGHVITAAVFLGIGFAVRTFLGCFGNNFLCYLLFESVCSCILPAVHAFMSITVVKTVQAIAALTLHFGKPARTLLHVIAACVGAFTKIRTLLHLLEFDELVQDVRLTQIFYVFLCSKVATTILANTGAWIIHLAVGDPRGQVALQAAVAEAMGAGFPAEHHALAHVHILHAHLAVESLANILPSQERV